MKIISTYKEKFIFFTLFFLLIQSFVSSQTIIRGVVKNAINESLENVNIFIKPINKGNIIVYSSSDNKGNYKLRISKKGKFNLFFSSLGYESKIIPLDVNGQKEIEYDIILKEKIFELNEIIIVAEKPITIKKDTITFKTKFFLRGNEQVVGDLLKNIPGLNIDSKGTVKVGNQEIEKLMIDGDDLFEKGYKILSKNMPSYPIEEVEILKNYSNNKLLKGIENSNKVALNLKLNEKSKRIWFGNISTGYGLKSKNRYLVQGNLMNFGKKNKYYFLTNINNIGSDATGDIWHLISPFRFNEPGSVGDDQRANSLLSLSSYTPSFKESRTNFNNAELLSLNAIFNPTRKLKIKTLGFFNWDENDFSRNSVEVFNTGTISFTNNEDFILRKERFTGFGKIDMIYDISKAQTLEFTTKYNNQNENSKSDLVFNTKKTIEKLKNKNRLFDQKISYANKFRRNKVFLLTGRYINEKTPQNYSINQFLYKELFSISTSNNVGQLSENNMQFMGFEAHLLDRKGNGDLFEIQFGNKFRKDKLLSSFLLKKNSTVVEMPAEYQNDVTYFSNDLYLNTKYLLKLKNLAFTGKLEFHQLYSRLEQTGRIKEQPFFINPKVGLEWEINNKNKIRTSYAYNTTTAKILNIYDNYVLTGFRSFSKGTGNFDQLNASTIIFNYQLGNWGNKFFANTFIFYTKNHDFYSTNSIIKQNYSRSEKLIFKDRELLSVSSNMDRYFKGISSNLKFKFNYSKSGYKNIVNSNLREVISNIYKYGLELRSGFSGIFNYHFGTEWTTNEIKTRSNNSFTNNTSFLDLSFVFTDKFNVGIQAERYFFGNLNTDNDDTYYFADFNARYTVKENKLTFSLSGKNLFNTERFKEFSISDIGNSTTEYRLLPRYVLLKMKYRF